jgi:RNA polymerase sigma-70 factor, ECF subfamily
MSQQELIILIQKDNVKAFDEFYKNNWRALYHMAYRSTGSIDDAKDLVQNVFISFWNMRESIDPEKFHLSYLFTSLRNSIINLHKKAEVRRQHAELQTEVYPLYTNEDHYIAKELAQALQNRVTQLPNKMQQVFVLSRYKNLSVAEISETLNITPQTVKNQLSNALKVLRAGIGMLVPILFYFF